MKRVRAHTFSEPDTIVAAGLREVSVQARVASLGGVAALGRARRTQLARDRDRALRKGDQARAAELEGLLVTQTRLGREIDSERQREAIVPMPVPKDQAVVRGRVTDGGQGRKGILVTLRDPQGETLALAQTDPKGAFELFHVPQDTVTVRVTDADGGHLLDRRGIDGPAAGQACYVELPIDGIMPMPPAPEPPPPDSEPSHVTVPWLRRLTEDEARAVLEEAGLLGEKTSEVPSDNLAGRVVEQNPEAGTPVPRQSVVGYVLGVQTGEGFPDLRGETLRAAVARVEEMGLAVQEIRMVAEPDRAGRVTAHVPPPDAAFDVGTRVLLRVGSGEPRADLTTAAYLFARDPRAGETGITEAAFRRRLTDGGIENMKDLRALSRGSADVIAEVLRIERRAVIQLVQRILVELVARFPEEG